MAGGRYLAQGRGAFPSMREVFDGEPNRSKMQNSGLIPAQKAVGSMKKACTEPGCPNLTDGGGKCPSCSRTAEKERGTTLQRGYAAGWPRLRALKLATDPICQIRTHCQGAVASEVDHIEPIRFRPDLRLEWSNLQSACSPCNSAKARRQARIDNIRVTRGPGGGRPVEIVPEGSR